MEMIFILTLVASFLALDTTHAFQIMISQPIFACSILGLLAGEFQIGLMVGIIFELLFLNILPVGGNQFPEGNLGAMSSFVFLISWGHFSTQNWEAMLPFAILLGILNSYVGMIFTNWHRKHNEKYVDILHKSIQTHQNIPRKLKFLIVRSMGHYVVFSFLMILITTQFFVHSLRYFTIFLPLEYPQFNAFIWVILFLTYGFLGLTPKFMNKRKKK